ncbi:inner kinetochore subunit Mhf1p [Trichomonascus vanleenenianus]|uniref:Mhf1p n=1 Tax=Trichomonascus vanleenenianus TaxID=2268995 RepID=UPI003EC9BCB9
MKEIPAEEQRTLERLMSSVWATVAQIVEEESQPDNLGVEATPEFVAALAKLVFNQAITLGEDLEAFAHHAGRKTVNVDDVKMVCRRNEGLKSAIEEYIAEISKK